MNNYTEEDKADWLAACSGGTTTLGFYDWVFERHKKAAAAGRLVRIASGELHDFEVVIDRYETLRFRLDVKAVSPLAAFKEALDTVLNYSEEEFNARGALNGCDYSTLVTDEKRREFAYDYADVDTSEEDDEQQEYRQ